LFSKECLGLEEEKKAKTLGICKITRTRDISKLCNVEQQIPEEEGSF
jgi:hypothetical protein